SHVRASALFHRPGPHRYLHSFPTRRSSDLGSATPGFHAPRGNSSRDAPRRGTGPRERLSPSARGAAATRSVAKSVPTQSVGTRRSEEHTSELQSLTNLVCRLLLEKKKQYDI